MGRSPFFEYFIAAKQAGRDLQIYKNLKFGDLVKMSAVEEVEQEPRCMEISRACSTYGREELYLPKLADVLRIERKYKKKIWKISEYDPWNPFDDDTDEKILCLRAVTEKRLPGEIGHVIESYLCAEYRFVEVESIDPTKMATFLLRSDGSLLNIEDFSYRGQIEDIEDVSSEFPKMNEDEEEDEEVDEEYI